MEEPVTISSAVELAHWEPRTQVFNCGVFLTVTYWSNLVIPFPFVTSKKKTVNNRHRLNSPDITAQLSSYFYLGRLWNLNTLNRSFEGHRFGPCTLKKKRSVTTFYYYFSVESHAPSCDLNPNGQVIEIVVVFYFRYCMHTWTTTFSDSDFGCYFVLVTAAVHSRCMAQRFRILMQCAHCCSRYMVTFYPPNCNGTCNCFVLVDKYWPTSLV